MYFVAEFEKKKTKVKQYVRKGRLVKGYNKEVEDKKAQQSISSVVVGGVAVAGIVGAIGIAGLFAASKGVEVDTALKTIEKNYIETKDLPKALAKETKTIATDIPQAKEIAPQAEGIVKDIEAIKKPKKRRVLTPVSKKVEAAKTPNYGEVVKLGNMAPRSRLEYEQLAQSTAPNLDKSFVKTRNDSLMWAVKEHGIVKTETAEQQFKQLKDKSLEVEQALMTRRMSLQKASDEIYQEYLKLSPVANDLLTFGYQEAWAEYRYKPNRISGLFRSTSAAVS